MSFLETKIFLLFLIPNQVRVEWGDASAVALGEGTCQGGIGCAE